MRTDAAYAHARINDINAARRWPRAQGSRDLWYQEAVIAVALAATFITDRAINLERSDGSQASKYLER